MRYLCGILMALYVALQPQPLYATDDDQLVMHGGIYPNSCEKNQKKILKDKLMKSTVADVEQAWRSTKLILCETNNPANRREVMSILQREVRQTTESPGDKKKISNVSRYEEIADDLMAEGKVWNVSVFAQRKKIVLQYFVNEACVRTTSLVYDKHKWSVYEIGEACD